MQEMSTLFTVIVWLVFACIIIFANIIYIKVVVPVLNQYGNDEHCEFLPSKQWKQIIKYRKLCVEKKLPLFFSSFMLAYQFIAVILIIVWMFIK